MLYGFGIKLRYAALELNYVMWFPDMVCKNHKKLTGKHVLEPPF